MSSALISAGDRSPKPSSSSAAEPATIGVAPEVPPNGVVSVPVPTSAEIEAPGAPISGLTMFVSIVGPREDEPTTVCSSGRPAAGSNRTLTDPDAAGAWGATLVFWWVIKAG